ncbi:MAG: ABC transporter ATP-binding protein [Candidatus Staskawiczbacteria bacterium]|nr:ABC transporter ATP-binding protein [Candidatus Staskawiczbacteria bacterium]
MDRPLIKFEDVWKIYKLGEIDLPVLRGVNLEIAPGSFATIMGPSGSGKSTLMYLMGLLDAPSKGKIYLQGQDVSDFSEDRLAEIRGKKIGFVFQQFNLLQNLTALENVMLPMIFQNVSESKRRETAINLLAMVNLSHRINHKPSEMSGGEQQRIAIARSLANSPEILIADEPTGNLDSKTGKAVMEVLTSLHKDQGKTIVVVTHDPNIAHYSQNIIHIQDGQVATNHFKEANVLWEK